MRLLWMTNHRYSLGLRRSGLCWAVLCCDVGGKGKAVSGSVIRATIPYVKADIPILVLFRALGTVVSRQWTACLLLDSQRHVVKAAVKASSGML